ncbi:hypothetical protein GE09DRAFT_582808 [Coniochaeta sp. 2T2.1]|nr:hypothetical protein GE09DRAFT_582808 [Coniochaeta sp. 2T2.1]
MLRERLLGKVLAVTPRLETLKWDCYYNVDGELRYLILHLALDEITSALTGVRQTLTSLTIPAEASEGRVGGPLRGSLAPMTEFIL